MVGEMQETARQRREKLRNMTLDQVASEAAGNPGSVYAQVAELEIRRCVAEGRIAAANAQRDAATPLKITAWATLVLALATACLAAVTAYAVYHHIPAP
jgi:hypothetical protein